MSWIMCLLWALLIFHGELHVVYQIRWKLILESIGTYFYFTWSASAFVPLECVYVSCQVLEISSKELELDGRWLLVLEKGNHRPEQFHVGTTFSPYHYKERGTLLMDERLANLAS